MYLSILLFPFLGALFSGLLGRKLGVSGSQLVSCLSLLLSAILSSIAFYNIGLLNNPVSITLGS
jgi:NADH-ubiquinone oxidoreductase chain 5